MLANTIITNGLPAAAGLMAELKAGDGTGGSFVELETSSYKIRIVGDVGVARLFDLPVERSRQRQVLGLAVQ